MSAVPAHPSPDDPPGLFHTRYACLASNTIDYWMLPDDATITARDVTTAIATAPVSDATSVQIYVHVPFCAQRCRFCAFSGGNSLEFAAAERYARLVIADLRASLERTQIGGRPVRSVHIGGGSPDLLGPHIESLLRAIRDIPGVTDATEIAVEFTASTATREFFDVLAAFEVTKVSFGVQSIDADVRKAMRQPTSMHFVERALDWIAGRIPIVNADLITGLPGQDLAVVNRDLRALLDEPRIQAISSYLLTPSAAPSLIAALENDAIPRPAPPQIQAAMRLHTYSTFQREGWLRRGTNTYVDPSRIDDDVLQRISGNECIGTADYDAFLISAGAQAVSNLPGARIENLVDIEAWCRAVESGEAPWHLPKCSTVHQRDTALWVMPLRWEGLPRARFERMLQNGALTSSQLGTLADLIREGLIVATPTGHELSILGEVFMGHLVRDLKSAEGRHAVDAYAAEGKALGRAIAAGELADDNPANNRQRATLPHADS